MAALCLFDVLLCTLMRPECPDLAAKLVGAGATALLAEPLLSLIASRECSGHVLPRGPKECHRG